MSIGKIMKNNFGIYKINDNIYSQSHGIAGVFLVLVVSLIVNHVFVVIISDLSDPNR